MIGSRSFDIGANEFLAGVTSGDNTEDGGFSNYTNHANITFKPGVIYPPGKETDMSTNVTGEIIASCVDKNYIGNDRLLLDKNGAFYTLNGTIVTKKVTSSSTFSKLTTDMLSWYSPSLGTNVFATTTAGANGDIVKWDSSVTLDEHWWTTTLSQPALSGFTPWRPLISYETNIYVGDKNKLHRIAPDLTVSNGILSLSYTENISALGIDQGTGKLLIATASGANYSDTRHTQSRIYIYNGYSNKAMRVVPVNGVISAFRSVGNTTFVFYGNKLGYWTGSGIKFLRTLNFGKGNYDNIISKHRCTSIDNTLYWMDTPHNYGSEGFSTYSTQIMAYGETINNRRSFYPAFQPPNAISSIGVLFAVTSIELGYSYGLTTFALKKFDAYNISNSIQVSVSFFSKIYKFDRNVTYNGVIVEFDQNLAAINYNVAGISMIDDNGNINTSDFLDPKTRSDIHKYEFTYPSVETRSIQIRMSLSVTNGYKIGVRRITVFYTPKE